jgi:hypothetical protein
MEPKQRNKVLIAGLAIGAIVVVQAATIGSMYVWGVRERNRLGEQYSRDNTALAKELEDLKSQLKKYQGGDTGAIKDPQGIKEGEPYGNDAIDPSSKDHVFFGKEVTSEYVTTQTSGSLVKVSDKLLNIEFSYPAEWGQLKAYLKGNRPADGVQADPTYGYAYEYMLSGRSVGLNIGGRSTDFTEGRGSIPTDFKGFENLKPAEFCNTYLPGSLKKCSVMNPNQIYAVQVPTSAMFCPQVPDSVFTEPSVILFVNLPNNKKINGFVFNFNFLSDDMDKVLSDAIAYNQEKCSNGDAAAKKAYDDKAKAAFDKVVNGTADTKTKKNLELFKVIVDSIKIK